MKSNMQTQKSTVPTLKNSAVIKVNEKAGKKIKADNIYNFEDGLNKMWQMFNIQLQRNMELMQIINTQQQQVNQLMQTINTVPPQQLSIPVIEQPLATPSVLPTPIAEHNNPKSVQSLPYSTVKELTQNFRDIFGTEITRIDGIHAIINFLNCLNQLTDASRDEMIATADISESACSRYTEFLRFRGFMNSKGTSRRCIFFITPAGKQFIEGKLFKREEYTNLTGIKLY
jgi:predicted transcriptional regulator